MCVRCNFGIVQCSVRDVCMVLCGAECAMFGAVRCSVDCARDENLQKLKRSLKRLRRTINDNLDKFAIQSVPVSLTL